MLQADLKHFGQSNNQQRGHFLAVEVSRGEIKLPYSVSNNGVLLQVIEANALVFGEEYPAFLSDKGQPRRIFGSGGKMLAVALMANAVVHERLQKGFAVVKIFVEVENEVFRRR